MKRFATILLVMVMILSMATTAFAAEKNDSITVTGTKVGETYALYKLFDLKVDNEENPAAYSYTVNSGWEEFFAGDAAKYITKNDAGYVTAISDAAALAKDAAAWTGKPTATQSTPATGTSVVFSGLENGYWLITSTLGTEAMIQTTPDKAAVTINEKNPEDTITKTVKEDSTGEFGTFNNAQIGDLVEFKSVITLNKSTRNVKVTDTMDEGLTYTAGSVAIDGLTKGTEYTVEEETATGFVISFSDEYIKTLTAATTLNLTYTATLNASVIQNTAIDAQINRIKITYGDQQSVEQTTTTTTHNFKIFKHANNSEENLAGATFELKKGDAVVKLIKINDTNYRVAMAGEAGAVETFTTVADGDIVIWGVDADSDYTLNETAAPAGYNKLTAEVAVTVSASNDTRVDVINNAGTELPSTGGVGTTVFYVIGGLMMLMAVVLLVTKKRMASAE